MHADLFMQVALLSQSEECMQTLDLGSTCRHDFHLSHHVWIDCIACVYM